MCGFIVSVIPYPTSGDLPDHPYPFHPWYVMCVCNDFYIISKSVHYFQVTLYAVKMVLYGISRWYDESLPQSVAKPVVVEVWHVKPCRPHGYRFLHCIYSAYIVKWCSGVACNWCVSLDITLI